MSADGGASEGRRQVVVCSPVDVCALIDELGPDAVGEIVLGSEAGTSGTVFIENGRVCWAAARGLARRFTALLVAHTGVSTDVVERVVLGCLADRAPLGQRLLEAGVVSAEQLRSTLLQHAAESLEVVCRLRSTAIWQPRRQRGYASRFTFTTAEMLARTLAEENATEAESGRAQLAQVFDRDELGVVFVRRADRSAPQPVALNGDWSLGTRSLLRIGRWAASALDVAQDAGEEPFVASSRSAFTLVAWSSGLLVLAGLTTEFGAARIFTLRAGLLLDSRRIVHGGL